MTAEQQKQPTFKKPAERQNAPASDMGRYFAYHTLRHRLEKQEREQGRGMYEDLRRYDDDEW